MSTLCSMRHLHARKSWPRRSMSVRRASMHVRFVDADSDAVLGLDDRAKFVEVPDTGAREASEGAAGRVSESEVVERLEEAHAEGVAPVLLLGHDRFEHRGEDSGCCPNPDRKGGAAAEGHRSGPLCVGCGGLSSPRPHTPLLKRAGSNCLEQKHHASPELSDACVVREEGKQDRMALLR
eukprot:1919648-Rhodomonas_salina.3